MSKTFFITLIFIFPCLAWGQSGSPARSGGSGQAVQHIDSVVTTFKQGKWQQVVAMFDSIVSNNYFTNNQIYFAVSKSLERLSGETSEPVKKDSLLKASKQVYQASVKEWGWKVMEGGVDLTVYSLTDQAPEPIGGMKKFNTYVERNLEYPADALAAKIEGKVYLQFVVNKDGTLDAISVQKSLCKSCDQEAIRVLQEGPKWTPGYQSGQPVFVRMVMPVTFSIKDYYRALKIRNTN